MIGFPPEKLKCRRGVNRRRKLNIMGDKSPKSNQKKSSQKQAMADSADRKKREAIAAKQAAGKNRNCPSPLSLLPKSGGQILKTAARLERVWSASPNFFLFFLPYTVT